MINIQTLTLADARQWQRLHPPTGRLTDLQLATRTATSLDEHVAVIATDGEKVVGRLFLFPCWLAFGDELIECRASGDLFVDERYRSRGVGPLLKMKQLQLGKPQIVGGVSGKMQAIYNRWTKFTAVDDSPVFQLATDFRAALFLARSCPPTSDGPQQHTPLRVVANLFPPYRIVRLAIAARRRMNIEPLPPSSAIAALPAMLHFSSARIQIPWNNTILQAGLNGRSKSLFATVISINSCGVETRHLITVYIKSKSIRLFGDRTTEILEGHVNEIFPPIENHEALYAVLGAVLTRAKALGISLLHLYANTSALLSVCLSLSLPSLFRKTVYFAANDLAPERAAYANDPMNWWCRAINEDQLKETIEQC